MSDTPTETNDRRIVDFLNAARDTEITQARFVLAFDEDAGVRVFECRYWDTALSLQRLAGHDVPAFVQEALICRVEEETLALGGVWRWSLSEDTLEREGDAYIDAGGDWHWDF